MTKKIKDLNLQIGATIKAIFNRQYSVTLDRSAVDEGLTVLFSSFMPYIIIAKKTKYGAAYKGINFRIDEVGICEIYEIDETVEHIRIPQAIFCEGKYYLVTKYSSSKVNRHLKSIHFHDGILEINMSNMFGVERITCDKKGLFSVIDGALYKNSYNGEPVEMIWFPKNYEGEEYHLPNSVTSISPYAFSNCDNVPFITCGKLFWDYNDYIWFISKNNEFYIDRDGNIYKMIFSYRTPHSDFSYIDLLLIRIKDESYIVPLEYQPIHCKGGETFFYLYGIDLEDKNDIVKEIHLYGYRSIPENFIRHKACLPNLESIILEEDLFKNGSKKGIDLPYYVQHEGIRYKVIDPTTGEVATSGRCAEYSNNTIFPKLDLPSEFEDGDLNYKLTIIGAYSFYQTSEIEIDEVIIPDTVTSIGDYAFCECFALQKISIPESVVKIGNYAFSGCNFLKEVILPSSLEEIGIEILGGTGVAKIIVREGSARYSTEDGILYNADKTVLVMYPPARKDKIFEIPDTVTEIGISAFQNCNLEKIVIPNSVKIIGDRAFYGCRGLKKIVIPDSVKTIGNEAFSFCADLTEPHLETSVSSIREFSIEDGYYHKTFIPQSEGSVEENEFKDCGDENPEMPFYETTIKTEDLIEALRSSGLIE